ncbi:MAG: formylglycine-generating enzyme family protein, partial [Planctomycetota bacterium]|nr:formylglycine-generating enzyme family protein [Planctomycetota bacterium]
RQSLEQLGDHRLVQALLEREQQELWPVRHELVQIGADWLEEARALLGRRASHEAFRERLQAGDASKDELVQLLDELLLDVEELEGRVPLVEERVEDARAFRAAWSEGAAGEAWMDCIAAVREHPAYDGLELTPQRGLLPLWESASSGLWEFFVVGSGELPDVDLEFAIEENPLREEDGVVLVLLPGGSFLMGASEELSGMSGFVPSMPLHEVELAPFFLSKYELTQAQWMRLDEGRNPSWYTPENPRALEHAGAEPLDPRHPVENVSWTEARELLRRQDLQLPTEAQWEYACRAGTESMFSYGDGRSDLDGAVNSAGSERTVVMAGAVDPWDDGWYRHAPVGSFRPNAFGLHEMHGNVQEWCEDQLIRGYDEVLRREGDGLDLRDDSQGERIFRGGSFYHRIISGASALRRWGQPDQRFGDLGLRPARDLR